MLSACLLISLMGYAQELTPDKVPTAVLKAFAKKHPAATEVKYELKHNNYEIAFRDKGIREFTKFNPTGKKRKYPNLQKKRIFVPELNKTVNIEVSARGMRTMKKNGIHATLLKAGLIK